MKNPLVYKNEMPVGYTYSLYSLAEQVALGAAYGAVAGRFFRWYTPQAGALMGAWAEGASFFSSRLQSNLNDESPKLERDISRAIWWASWFAPLMPKLFGQTVGTLKGYWLSMPLLWVCLLPVHGLKNSLLKKLSVGEVTYNFGIVELLDRPWLHRFSQRVTDKSLVSLPPEPQLREANEITAPTLKEQLEEYYVERYRRLAAVYEPPIDLSDLEGGYEAYLEAYHGDGPALEKAKEAVADVLKKVEQAEKQPVIEETTEGAAEGRFPSAGPVAAREKARGERVTAEHYHKLLRNVSLKLDSLGFEERQAYLCRICAIFEGGCPQRYVQELYEMLVDMEAGELPSGDSIESVKRRVERAALRRNSALKQEIFRKLYSRFTDTSDESMALCSFQVGLKDRIQIKHGGELGEAALEMNMANTRIEVDGNSSPEQRAAAQAIGGFLGGAAASLMNWGFNKSVENFQGLNESFWVRAFRARYNADYLVREHREGINSIDTDRQDAMAYLSNHINGLLPGGTDLDPAEEAQRLYCETIGGQLRLNNEGVILLLKLTGHFENDGRLHTTLSNDEILIASCGVGQLR